MEYVKPLRRAERKLAKVVSGMVRPFLTKPSADELMAKMDHWGANHPWAKGGWVPEDKITTDYAKVLPDKQLVGNPTPFPIQQVRREIKGFLEVVLGLQKRDKIVEIGMGYAGGTHTLWTNVFPKVITVELSPERVENYLLDQKPDRQQSIFVAGNSDRLYIISQVHHLGQGCDVLFIDGDHSRIAVERDWRNYHMLVRKGGIIAFHDTVLDAPPEIEVKSFLDDLASGKITGKPIKLHNIHHSICTGISYYYVD